MISHGRMGFVGVDTARSSIQRVFPLWAERLGLPSTQLRGFDIPIGSPDADYREVVRMIADDPDQAGALVTTHKVRLFEAAGNLFDEFDEFALACAEVSSISKRDGRLIGHAKDPITAGCALEAIVDDDYFARTGAEVLILGAGGSAIALSWYLAWRRDRPSRVTLAGRSLHSIRRARRVHSRGALPQSLFDYHLLDQADTKRDAARLVSTAPTCTVVVNATGLGKDRPGSPVSDAIVFPRHSVVWDFNYRGTLEFLRQARAQQAEQELTVSDGWIYFVHGWSQVIAEVFDVPMPPAQVDELSRLAGSVR